MLDEMAMPLHRVSGHPCDESILAPGVYDFLSPGIFIEYGLQTINDFGDGFPFGVLNLGPQFLQLLVVVGISQSEDLESSPSQVLLLGLA